MLLITETTLEGDLPARTEDGRLVAPFGPLVLCRVPAMGAQPGLQQGGIAAQPSIEPATPSRPRPQPQVMEDDFLVDLLDPPSCSLGMISTVLTALLRNPAAQIAGAPFVYVNAAQGHSDWQGLTERLSADPRLFEQVLAPEGHLACLALGPLVTANPLFLTFFRNLGSGLPESAVPESLDVLRQHV